MRRSFSTLLLLGLSACSLYRPSSIGTEGELPEAELAEGPRFRSLADAILAWRWATAPPRATYDGVHEHDDRLGSWSREQIQERITALKEYEGRLERIDVALLDDDDYHDARLLKSRVKGDLLALEQVRRWERDPGFYRQIIAEGLASIASLAFDTLERRMGRAAARLGEVPELLLRARENLKRPPKLFTEVAIAEFEGLERFIDGGLRSAFAAVEEPGVKARFAVVHQAALDAVRVFRTWLSKELLPASDGSFALGPEVYAAKLRHDEGVELPLDALRARGRALLLETQKAMKALAGERPVPEALREGAGAGDPADLLGRARAGLDELKAWAAGELTLPPDAVCSVQETPVYRRELSFASMELPGAFETVAREAYYSITLPDPAWSDERRSQHLSFFGGPRLALISVHEAYPGHLVQVLAARKAPTRVRRALSAASFSEGWAHYCEELYAESKPRDRGLRLQQLSMALLRICRYLAGIELHAGGWTVEQAADFFVQEGWQERAVADREARRGALDPTYLVYTLGKAEIRSLRDDWMARTGRSRRDFHDALLALGAPPLPIARSILLGERPRD